MSWARPAAIDSWPTRTLASERLRYALEVPAGWAGAPAASDLPTHREELLRGEGRDEGLLVQFMETADPAADLRGWADAPVRLAGAPAVSLQLAGGERPELLEWREAPAPPGLAERLAADEVALYEGLTRSPAPPATLGRIYTVLARRGPLAWHVALVLESACPPGSPADTIERNDHARAAAVVGTLRLG